MRQLLALVVCSFISTAAFADDWRLGRIRSQDYRSTAVLRDGIARSATFRALVERIEANNVIVYVSVSPIMKSSLAGKLTWMTRAGEFRYLRVTLNTEQTADQLVATLGHELQHVIEVVDEAAVTDQRSLEKFYERIGRPSHSGIAKAWETDAAQDTGYRVRRELSTANAVALSATSQLRAPGRGSDRF